MRDVTKLIGTIVGEDLVVAVFLQGKVLYAVYERPDGSRYQDLAPSN